MIGAVAGLVAGVLLRDAFKPDDFYADWYGWITNFGSHIFLMIAGLCVTVSALAYYDAVPLQMDLAIQGVAFSVAFQTVQRWQGGTVFDSIDDAFVMGGSWAAPCFLFKVGPDNLPKLQSWAAMTAVISVVIVYGLYGVGLRVWQEKRGRKL